MKLYSKMNVGCGPGSEPSVTCVLRWTYHCHPLHTGSVWVSRDVRGDAGILGNQGIQEESCPDFFFSFSLFLFCFVFRPCFFFSFCCGLSGFV